MKAIQAFNLMRFGATFLIGVLLAKSGIPTGEISLYETWLFFGNILTFFWLGGGHNALVSLYPRLHSPEARGTVMFQAFVLFTLLSLLAAGLLLSLGGWIGPRFAHSGQVPYVWLLCIFVVGNVPSQLVQLFYLLEERSGAILYYGMASFGLQVVAVLAPVWAGYGIRGALVSLAVWAALKWIWLLMLVVRQGRWKWERTIFRQYLWAMLPLTLHVLLGNSVEYTDGLIVAGFFEDEKQFALFRFGARELPITMLLVGGIVTGLIPVTTRDQEKGLEEIRRRTARLSDWLFPLSGVLMFLSPVLFPLVYNDDFAISAQVFNIYLLILSSRILLPQVLVISRQKNFFLVANALFELGLNVGLSLWWVRSWGLEGIAMASVVAFLVNKMVLIAFNAAVLKVGPSAYIPLQRWTLYTAGLFLCYLMANWIYG